MHRSSIFFPSNFSNRETEQTFVGRNVFLGGVKKILVACDLSLPSALSCAPFGLKQTRSLVQQSFSAKKDELGPETDLNNTESTRKKIQHMGEWEVLFSNGMQEALGGCRHERLFCRGI